MKKELLFSGALVLAAPAFIGCGAACGDGVTDIGEECDDGNVTDGDVCSAACTFEAAKTDYRLSELTLIDDLNPARFGQSNQLILTAINNPDITKAFNVVIKFDSTADGATNVTFGPGTFVDEVNGVDTFDFLENLNGTVITPAPIPTDITGGVASFQGADLVVPIEVEFGSGIFAPLPIRDVNVTANFDHKQLLNTGLFVDILNDESTINATVAVLDLCALNIVLVPGGEPVNLLDAFDDGTPANDSSITTPLNETPDGNNCQPCQGPGADADCVIPENDPDAQVAGDELYDISATFSADGDVVVNPLP